MEACTNETVFIFGCCSFLYDVGYATVRTKPPGQKILVAYFSWSENTRVIAEQIQKLTNADIFEIKATKPYPTGWNDVVAQAQKEERENDRPSIVSKVNNMDADLQL
jgi:hypothetical protein